jgi:hypothetical protein
MEIAMNESSALLAALFSIFLREGRGPRQNLKGDSVKIVNISSFTYLNVNIGVHEPNPGSAYRMMMDHG